MRVLVTGYRGYVGSVLVGVLRNSHYEVIGLDCDFYQDCDFGRIRETIPSYDIDIRDIEFGDLLSFDAVIHLAGLPENAADSVDPVTAREIDLEATVRLAECCKKAHVSRFLFASSCAVYGRGNTRPLDERHPPTPTTPHALSKLHCERALIEMADDAFTPVILRNASVYGVSPRLRLDLFVNACVASAVTTGHAVMPNNGHTFRMLVHVEDVARAYAAVLAAPDGLVRGEVFNVAHPGESYRMIDVADTVTELIPQCTRRVTPEVFDEPSYRIDASKLARTLPRLAFRWTLPTGIRQLRNAMESAGTTPGDLRSDRYHRALRLKTLMERDDLDSALRRTEPALV